MGDSTFYIAGSSGATENRDTILIYPDIESIPFAYVDYELWDMDGTVQTYIYLDGVEMDKQQAGEGYQSSIPLENEWQVSAGSHKVEAVQYEGNDPSGTISFYCSAEYTVANGDTAAASGPDTTTSLPDGTYSDVGNGTFYISNSSAILKIEMRSLFTLTWIPSRSHISIMSCGISMALSLPISTLTARR